jgi:hypothetical protein
MFCNAKIIEVISRHVPCFTAGNNTLTLEVSKLLLIINDLRKTQAYKAPQKPAKPKACPISPKNYTDGYRQGYLDRSDELYDEAMFGRWKEHVAGITEINAQFNAHSRAKEEIDVDENFEIVEPEVIC